MRPHVVFSMLLVVFVAIGTAKAMADVIEIQRLDFGKWYIPGNNSVYDITVGTNGSYSHSPQLTMLTAPHPGIYDIGELTASSVINSIDAVENTPLQSGGNSFTMDNFQTSTSGSTDASGRVTVTIGASAHTTGAGGGYPTGTYNGLIDLTFNF